MLLRDVHVASNKEYTRGKKTEKSTLTSNVLGAKMECASIPFRYAFTSGIPDPAAAGAISAQRAAAQVARTTLQPAKAANARKYLL